MARQEKSDPRSIGRSIAVPLAFFGLLAFVVGAVRMLSGEEQTFVLLLGGVFLLVGAVTAYVVGERVAGSRDSRA